MAWTFWPLNPAADAVSAGKFNFLRGETFMLYGLNKEQFDGLLSTVKSYVGECNSGQIGNTGGNQLLLLAFFLQEDTPSTTTPNTSQINIEHDCVFALELTTKRVTASLLRANITSITRLIRCYEAGLVSRLNGITEKAFLEIEEKLIALGVPKTYQKRPRYSSEPKLRWSDLSEIIRYGEC